MSEKREVFGFTVEGYAPQSGRTWVTQRPGNELLYEMVKLFDMGIDHVTWHQYTPWFNDGDTCEFSVYDMSVYAQPSYDEPLTRKVLERRYKNRVYSWEKHEYVDEGYTEEEVVRAYEPGYDFEVSTNDDYPHPEFLPESDAMAQGRKVNGMLTGGEFERFLQETFGDGVEITFDGEKFTYDEYSHD